jgi:predicted Zn-dependent protease
VLVAIGKHAEAEPHLLRAIELEPWYAASYAVLGAAYEGLGKTAEAGEQYAKFMERASRNHDRRPMVQARVAALGAGGAK